ncbi:hypothetical protein O181_063541 [Austropuccinia psidii MF-1]|uniref:Chromo domain-containing protein n=1 Tax=Austropuccinia psidii MF-1 TaxID=1389203 RepID=A0A9Q3HZH5_9BASI|nr:hypothetical protein [Austropuccinia psidii MF-1]
MIHTLHGPNAVKLEWAGDLMSKHPTFPVGSMKPYSSRANQCFPLINKPSLEIAPLEEAEEKKIPKVLEERRIRNTKEREYLVRYRNLTQEEEWLLEKDMNNSEEYLGSLRHSRK